MRFDLTRQAVALVLALALVASVGCARKRPPEAAAQAPTPAATPAEAAPAAPAAQAAESGALAGTAWRLVKIMSMDDSTYMPDDPALYTLEFGEDGVAKVKADCNLATGSWTSESAGQLQFGVMAATMAECAPGSLHDRYMGQFEWVRSYVVEDGHLFLSTMADGAIIEFEPSTPAP